MRIALVDTTLGNLRSVLRAARDATGREVYVTADPELVRRADALIVPGQGAFRDCARALEPGLGEAVRESIARGAPYLGVCLGMQILFEASEEAPGASGLGIFRGRVRRIDPGPGEKVPHTGWNAVELARPSALREGWFYFVHSFVCAPADRSIVAAETVHGRDRFVSAVARDNVLAVQFHPEKSQRAGLELLARFFGQFD